MEFATFIIYFFSRLPSAYILDLAILVLILTFWLFPVLCFLLLAYSILRLRPSQTGQLVRPRMPLRAAQALVRALCRGGAAGAAQGLQRRVLACARRRAVLRQDYHGKPQPTRRQVGKSNMIKY